MTTPFTDLDAFNALPRVSSLALSPDGRRLITSVATLDSDSVRWVNALWEVDPTGTEPAIRLTRSRKGETAPVFLPNGDLLFTSARPDPDAKETPDDAPAALWLLPARGGEARVVGTRAGGVGGVVVARDAGTVVVSSSTLPGSGDSDDDEKRRKERKDKKVNAILHTGYPVRYWDHDLGPGAPRLLCGTVEDHERLTWRDLTPVPERALDNASYDVSADGRVVVTTWTVAEPRGSRRSTLVVLEDGEQRTLLDESAHEYSGPRISPDGRLVAVTRSTRSAPDAPPDERLVVVPLDGSAEARDVAPAWDRWVLERRWTADGTALIVTADEGGGCPVFRI